MARVGELPTERAQIGKNHNITHHGIDIIVDSPYALIRQSLWIEPTKLHALDNDAQMDDGTDSNTQIFLHRLNNSMSIRSVKATVYTTYDSSVPRSIHRD